MPKCVVALLALVLVAAVSGCATLISKDIVLAPNAGRTARQVGDASQKTLEEQFIAKQVRVKVGTPAASLSAWIVEAWSVTVDARLKETTDDGSPKPADDDTAFAKEFRADYARAKGERIELTLLNGAILEPMEQSHARGNLKVHFQFGMLTAWQGPPTTRPSANRRPPRGRSSSCTASATARTRCRTCCGPASWRRRGTARCWSTCGGTGGRPAGT